MIFFPRSLLGLLVFFVQICLIQEVQASEDQTLKPTVVTASRTEQIVTDVIPHTTVLGREVIEQSQLIDLPSLLAREAGFQFTQNGGRGTQASAFLRGAASMQVLVLVDGAPMTKQDTTGAVSLEHIMLDQVDHIEIVRGNVSAIYGSGAIGGVIQVFTREGQMQPSTYITSEVGSYGSKKSLVGTQGKKGEWQYAFSVGNNSTQGINAINPTQGLNVNSDNDGYRNDNYALNLSYQLNPSEKLGLRSSGTFGRFEYDVSDATYAAKTDINKGSSQINSHALYWHSQISQMWKSKLHLSDVTEQNIATTLGLYPFDSKADTHTHNLSWVNEFILSNWIATLGLDSQVQEVNTSDSYGGSLSKSRNNNALYFGGIYTHGTDSVQLNVRHDVVQQTGNKTTSYLGYARSLSENWKLTASHSTAFNVAPLGYLYDPISGNANLKPETAVTDELGLQWVGGNHLLRSTFFKTQTKDLLLYDNMTNFRFQNISNAKNEGLETSYSGRFDRTDLRVSLTLQDPTNESTGASLERRAKTLASTSLSHMIDRWTWGASLRYTGSRPDTSGKPELSSYLLVDTTARYRLSPDWTVFGRIENLSGKSYQTAYSYNQMPRSIYVGATWNLKH